MTSLIPRELIEKYAPSIAYVAVELPNGNQSIGTAFHVGEGVFVTARHVIENRRILEIANTTGHNVKDVSGNLRLRGKAETFRHVPAARGRIVRGPLFHPDDSVDVGAVVVEGIECPAIPLGSHLDDLINDDSFVLAQVVIAGYPPVPTSIRPVLIVSRAEINAVVDVYTANHPRFIVSSIARGGFSGGPCLVEWDFALGVVTQSLVQGELPAESGYMAVLSVEPIYQLLAHHKVLPAGQREGWGGLWDT
jgi:V8-like Glu-specific endopeptidase